MGRGGTRPTGGGGGCGAVECVHAIAGARVMDRRAGRGGRRGGGAGFGKDQGKAESGDVAELGDPGFAGGDVDVDIEDAETAGREAVSDDAAVELVGAGGEMGSDGLEEFWGDGAFLDEPGDGASAVGADGGAGGYDGFGEGFVDAGDGGEDGGRGGIDVDEAWFGLVGGAGGEVFEDEWEFVLGDAGGDGDLGALGVLDLGGGIEEVGGVIDAGPGGANGLEVVGEGRGEVDGREGIRGVVEAGASSAFAGEVGVGGVEGEVLDQAAVEVAVLIEVFGGLEAAVLVDVFAEEKGVGEGGELEEVFEAVDGGWGRGRV